MKKMTSTGFEYSIDERIKTDWDFLLLLTELQKKPSDMSILEKLIIKVLGQKGFEKLKSHISKRNDGFCPVNEVSAEIMEILKTDDASKK